MTLLRTCTEEPLGWAKATRCNIKTPSRQVDPGHLQGGGHYTITKQSMAEAQDLDCFQLITANVLTLGSA